MMTSENKQFIRDVVTDLSSIKMEATIPWSDCLKEFYQVMLKYGIKQGDKTNHGSVTMYNAEWIIFLSWFENRYELQKVFWNLLGDIPEELESY